MVTGAILELSCSQEAFTANFYLQSVQGEFFLFAVCSHAVIIYFGGLGLASSLKSQVVLLQTAHSWANAGVLLGARMHRERGSFRNN